MPTFSRRLLVAAAGAAGALALAGCNQGVGGGPATGDAMSMGNADAPVKMIEYASLTCSHCATFNNEVFPEFKKKYIDTGRVHYTLKEFLTPPENVASAGFLLARCAGSDKYFGVVDAIFRSQEQMFISGDPRGTLLTVAKSAGMSEEQFNKCLSDEKAREDLNARVEKAVRSDGVSSTPTFFINGRKVKEGAMTMAELDAAVAEASK